MDWELLLASKDWYKIFFYLFILFIYFFLRKQQALGEFYSQGPLF